MPSGRKPKLGAEGLETWLHRNRRTQCPDHGHRHRYNLVKGTFWCPVCRRVWRMRRDIATWTAWWWYMDSPQEKRAYREKEE